jgi:hypothetical protein
MQYGHSKGIPAKALSSFGGGGTCSLSGFPIDEA